MTKFNVKNPVTQLIPAGTPGSLPVAPGGSNDFLGRIESTARTIKGVLELAMKAKGISLDAPQALPPAPGEQGKIDDSRRRPAPGLIDTLIAQGLGDKTVEELLESIKPYTLKQIAGYMKNAGLT